MRSLPVRRRILAALVACTIGAVAVPLAVAAAPLNAVRLVSEGSGGSLNPQSLTPAGTTLFFFGTSTAGGAELWATDATAAGTRQVKDINPGAGSSVASGGDVITDTATLGNKVFFKADDGTTGQELWVSDGTAAGTHIVQDLAPGAPSSYPTNPTTFKGKVYFGASGKAGGNSGEPYDLWSTDGTAEGTQVVSDVADESGVKNLIVAGDQLYFLSGLGIWVSDGTGAGTHRIGTFADCCVGDAGGPLAAIGNRIVFGIAPGTPDPDNGLWITDGTRAGSTKLKGVEELLPLIKRPHGIGGKVYFAGATAGSTAYEPWVTDGTAAGTMQLADLNPGKDAASEPGNFTEVAGGKVIFTAISAAGGAELYVTDGTPAGTTLLKELNPGAGSGVNASGGYYEPPAWAVIDGVAYFAGFAGKTNFTLWRSDGTAAGTVPVTPGQLPNMPANPEQVVFGGGVFFSASDADGGPDLFAASSGPSATCKKAKTALTKANAKLAKVKRNGSAKAVAKAQKAVKKAKAKRRKACG